MTQSPKLSIIIPVYNSEKFLGRCLDSVVAQSYRNLEVLLVNDGSSDSSDKICKEYSKKYPFIRIFHGVNKGASESRNIGLKKATGEFITFIDSDDFLSPNIYCEAMSAFQDDIDIIIFGANTVTANGELLATDKYFNKIYSPDEFISEIIVKLKTAVWNKIFRKSCISNALFPSEYSHNEDMVFCCKCIHRDSLIKSIPNIGYNYVKHQNSVTSRPFSVKSFDEIKAKDLSAEIISSEFPEFKNLMTNVKIRGRLNIMRRLASLKHDKFTNEKAEIKSWLNENVTWKTVGIKTMVMSLILCNDLLAKIIFGK